MTPLTRKALVEVIVKHKPPVCNSAQVGGCDVLARFPWEGE